jgi:hypothetical protein
MTTLTATRARCAARLGAALLALGLLNSCGGTTEQITPFAPTALLVFGDEMSVLTKELPRGRKYSVNALGSDGVAIDCTLRPLWIQVVADTFLFSFEECNSASTIVKPAKIYAAAGAKATDFPAQVAAALAVAGGAFKGTDLATVLLGANDVLDLYRTQYIPSTAVYPNFATNPVYAEILAELNARGARLGNQINDLTALGPKVLLSTMPLMNLTPYALKEAIDRKDSTILTVLLNFSNQFNTALRVNIINDGRWIGLVELDALLNAGATNPQNYGLTNVTNAVCDPITWGTPDCRTDTLVVGGNATTWLWASDIWMGSTAHLNLGNFARGRALGNPFGSEPRP